MGIWKENSLILRGLTIAMVKNHLLSGMILGVVPPHLGDFWSQIDPRFITCSSPPGRMINVAPSRLIWDSYTYTKPLWKSRSRSAPWVLFHFFCLQDKQLQRWIKGVFGFLCELQCWFDNVIQGAFIFEQFQEHWVFRGLYCPVMWGLF